MVSSLENKSKQYASLDADASARVLAGKIRRQEPFFFVRYGDGALECMAGKPGQTCDHETYSPALGEELRRSWAQLMTGPNVYVGDWMTASFDSASEGSRYADEYAALIGRGQPTFLHFEALLLMRESSDLVDFYRAVKEDPRRKLFMGPECNREAAAMLGADFLGTPMRKLFNYTGALTEALLVREDQVVLYGCGMAGTIPCVRVWRDRETVTFVNLGSAMDPLFSRGQSRRQQLAPERARQYFKEEELL